MAFFSFLGRAASMVDLWKRRRERMLWLSKYTEDVMRGDSPLSRGQREMIAAMVSGLNGCAYCYSSHAAFAGAYGIGEDAIGALVQDPNSAEDQAMRPLLAFCRKLTAAPDSLDEADAKAVYDAGWSEEALEDAIHVTSLFNLYNRLLDGHGIGAREETALKGRAKFIKEHGYDFSTYPKEMQP